MLEPFYETMALHCAPKAMILKPTVLCIYIYTNACMHTYRHTHIINIYIYIHIYICRKYMNVYLYTYPPMAGAGRLALSGMPLGTAFFCIQAHAEGIWGAEM